MTAAVRVRLVLFALIAAVAVTYAGAKYARLTDYVSPSGYTVYVDLERSGGLFPGAEVTYRGVPVGEVHDLRLTRDGVAAELRIDDGVRVPSHVTANVHNRSAVGEQYVDLVPEGTGGGDHLVDGSRIARPQTTTPLPEEVLLTNLDSFVESIDKADLRTVVDALGTGLRGAGPDLQSILDNTDAVLAQAQGSLPETRALIGDAGVVLRTQAEHASDLRTFSANLALLTRTLRERDPELRAVIERGGPAATQLTALVNGLQSVTPTFVSATIAVIGTLGLNLAALEQAFVAFPESLAAAQVGVRGGQAQFTLATTSDPPACQRGYIPPSEWRSPRDLSDAQIRYDLSCTDPDKVWRGSGRAP